MSSGGFKRSSRFGLIGVFVVAALAIAIGLTMGEGEANPKLAMALIFGVIAIFVVVLLVLQRSDLERVAGGDAAARSRAGAEGGGHLQDPTVVPEAELWAALAIAPIDADAIKAQSEMWDVGRRSIKLGAVIFALIFLTVPPVYLLESFVPLLIGVPLIVIAALYGSFRAIGPGGEIQQGYERLDRAMKPLGLQVSARPKGGFEARGPTMPGFDYRLRGATELSGERHGRRVTIRFGGHEDAGHSEVEIVFPCSAFEAKSRRVEVRSGPEGIVVSRRKAKQGEWLCDLWLAERLLAG
ncbi:MAG TPA: hypothetical protein VHP56_07560 [Solirubrobacterales bacterium]|nr:hypothetical protein [Solirubrobacterales bacterium]